MLNLIYDMRNPEEYFDRLYDDDEKKCLCDGKHVCIRCLRKEKEFYEEEE